jgi:hypothetical protein
MKLVTEMKRDELIELLAAVSLRIFAFDYAVSAFRHIYHFSSYLSRIHGFSVRTMVTADSTVNGYVMDIGYDVIMSAVMFLLTVPLARLICRGLSQALDFVPPNKVSA